MRTVLGLYALALAVRLVLIAGFPDPAYPHTDVAANPDQGSTSSTVMVAWATR